MFCQSSQMSVRYFSFVVKSQALKINSRRHVFFYLFILFSLDNYAKNIAREKEIFYASCESIVQTYTHAFDHIFSLSLSFHVCVMQFGLSSLSFSAIYFSHFFSLLLFEHAHISPFYFPNRLLFWFFFFPCTENNKGGRAAMYLRTTKKDKILRLIRLTNIQSQDI